MEFKEFQSRISQCASNDDKWRVLWNIENAQKLFDDLTKPKLETGIPSDNRNVLVYTMSKDGKAHVVVGNYVHRFSEESTLSRDGQDTEYHEERDIFYVKENWFEQSVYGYGDFASWYISDEVIGWRECPAVEDAKCTENCAQHNPGQCGEMPK